MITVSFLNRKGGVGKTSSCFHLAGELARRGRRILLVDNDPQASLTQGFWGPEATTALHPASTVAALYGPDSDPAPEALVAPTGFDRIAIVPGSEHADRFNRPDESAWPDDPTRLRSFLAEVGADYDLALIDCPPTIYWCAWCALAASDRVVVPVQAEDFGSQGIAYVLRSVERCRTSANPGIALAGLLVTLYDRRLAVHVGYDDLLRGIYGDGVFRERMARAKDFQEAVMLRRPISAYKPKSAAARAVAKLADEFEARIGLAGDAREVAA
jgi:chromosome partitioning protein